MKYWFCAYSEKFLTKPDGFRDHDGEYWYCYEVDIESKSNVYYYGNGYDSGIDIFQDKLKFKKIINEFKTMEDSKCITERPIYFSFQGFQVK